MLKAIRNKLNKNDGETIHVVIEAEPVYWLGVPFWGRGLVPEASRELLRYAFEDLKLARVWYG